VIHFKDGMNGWEKAEKSLQFRSRSVFTKTLRQIPVSHFRKTDVFLCH
jgi:hypothetical protein